MVHKKIVRVLDCVLLMAMFLGSGQSASASDSYPQYVSDVRLLESRLMLDTGRPFVYDNSANGRLLKSVLDKDRFQAANAFYMQAVADKQKIEKLPVLIQPVLDIYRKAFAELGPRYENEYLDTLQLFGVILTSAPPLLTVPSAATVPGSPSPGNVITQATINKMNAAMQFLTVVIRRNVANTILNDIQKMKFSVSGGQRALLIAESIMPPAKVTSGSSLAKQLASTIGPKPLTLSAPPTPRASPTPPASSMQHTPSPLSEPADIPEAKSITYIRSPVFDYPASAKEKKQEGTVILRAKVDEFGRIRTVLITRSSGVPALDIAAQKAMEDALCEPYVLNGKTIPVLITLPVIFKLDSSEEAKLAAAGIGASDAEAVRDRIRANTIFSVPADVKGNDAVTYTITLNLDGTVLSAMMDKSSGVSDFDVAVRVAIYKSQPFPEISNRAGGERTKFVIRSYLKSFSLVTPAG